jgi:hypothetical protein
LIKGILRQLVGWLLNFISVRKIIVLGDSHALAFSSLRFRCYFPLTKFDVCSVGGATASGLDNPNSVTAAYATFNNKLSSATKNSIVIVMLGEVDTGFVIWWRAQKQGGDVNLMLSQAVEKYAKFISEINGTYRPLVMSTPMPTITDDNDWGEVANLRREITATQRERADLTLRFNSEIRRYCDSHGIPYIDLDQESLGEDGLVADHLISANRDDHHYSVPQHLKIMMPKLRPALKAFR